MGIQIVDDSTDDRLLIQSIPRQRAGYEEAFVAQGSAAAAFRLPQASTACGRWR